jgi:hypothetical protein
VSCLVRSASLLRPGRELGLDLPVSAWHRCGQLSPLKLRITNCEYCIWVVVNRNSAEDGDHIRRGDGETYPGMARYSYFRLKHQRPVKIGKTERPQGGEFSACPRNLSSPGKSRPRKRTGPQNSHLKAKPKQKPPRLEPGENIRIWWIILRRRRNSSSHLGLREASLNADH